jgi:uncharacterized protein YbaR (Trm112 family)
MKKFVCPKCGKTLNNITMVYQHEDRDEVNKNEFFCDDCNKIYIVEDNNAVIEEENE